MNYTFDNLNIIVFRIYNDKADYIFAKIKIEYYYGDTKLNI